MSSRRKTANGSRQEPIFSHLYQKIYTLIDEFRIQSFDKFALHLVIEPESDRKKISALTDVLDPAALTVGRSLAEALASAVQPTSSLSINIQTTSSESSSSSSVISQPNHPAQTPGRPVPIGLNLVPVSHSAEASRDHPSIYRQELFKYTFAWTEECTYYLITRFNRRAQIVQVKLGGTWYPLTNYLSFEVQRNNTNPNHNPDLTPEQRRENAYLAQQDWWYHNGKNFPILHLPPEVRDVVYRYSINGSIEPYARDNRRFYKSHVLKPENWMISSLLKCNLKIGTEARRHFFRHHSMLFTHNRLLSRTLNTRSFPGHELSYLTLAFPTHGDWIRFFGFRGKDLESGFWVNEFPQLQTRLLGRDNLPNIRRLEVVVADRETLEGTEWLKGGCQVKTVELVLRGVWRVVEGQPVVLSGMVKTWQKRMVEGWVTEVMEIRDGWVRDEHGEWIKQTGEVGDEEEDDDDDEDGGVAVSEDQIKRHEEAMEKWEEKTKAEEHKGDDEDEEDEEDEGEYDELAGLPVVQLPPVCECDPPCLTGDWVE